MIVESGRVVAIEENSLWVETIRKTTCNSCSAQKGCGHGILNKLGDGRSNYIRVLTGQYMSSEFSLNDEVEISIPEQVIVSGSFIVYMVPLLLMLLGAPLGEDIFSVFLEKNVGAIIGSIIGFIAGIVLVRWHSIKTSDNSDYQPQLAGLSKPSVINLL
jgi:sigma-E factor negative regulatory protein RseC